MDRCGKAKAVDKDARIVEALKTFLKEKYGVDFNDDDFEECEVGKEGIIQPEVLEEDDAETYYYPDECVNEVVEGDTADSLDASRYDMRFVSYDGMCCIKDGVFCVESVQV